MAATTHAIRAASHLPADVIDDLYTDLAHSADTAALLERQVAAASAGIGMDSRLEHAIAYAAEARREIRSFLQDLEASHE